MPDQFSRTRLLLGAEAVRTLQQARVIVYGVGGVGGFAVEALARVGVGTIDLVDNDTVCLTNINRQIIATHQSVGRYKTEVMASASMTSTRTASSIVTSAFSCRKPVRNSISRSMIMSSMRSIP